VQNASQTAYLLIPSKANKAQKAKSLQNAYNTDLLIKKQSRKIEKQKSPLPNLISIPPSL